MSNSTDQCSEIEMTLYCTSTILDEGFSSSAFRNDLVMSITARDLGNQMSEMKYMNFENDDYA